jgi:cytoskeletal protein RodZ
MFSVGQMLREERERKNIRLQDVEKAIKIRTKYLEQIENNNWSSFSSKIYIIGIINNYAKYLNLDKKNWSRFSGSSMSGKRR